MMNSSFQRLLAFSLLLLLPNTATGFHVQQPKTNYPFSLYSHDSSSSSTAETTAAIKDNDDDNSGSVVQLKNPATGQQVTLIGTAHLSEQSNALVKDMITSIQPDAVLVELDKSRLHRIGLTESDLGDDFVTAGDDIQPPLLQDDIEAQNNKPWWSPATDFFTGAFSKLCRKLLTGMYEDMGQNMVAKGEEAMVGGGEFLAAIQTAKSNNPTTKIILGDRSSVITIQRAAELAIRSGDPWGIFNRLNEANKEEMKKLEAKVKKELGEDSTPEEFNVALIETIKGDATFRQRLFDRLEEEVPEFTRAFLTERDYIMAEAIRQESDAKHVIAVVGLGHVPGMANNLRQEGSFQDLS